MLGSFALWVSWCFPERKGASCAECTGAARLEPVSIFSLPPPGLGSQNGGHSRRDGDQRTLEKTLGAKRDTQSTGDPFAESIVLFFASKGENE
jgi:hypothetical protein